MFVHGQSTCWNENVAHLSVFSSSGTKSFRFARTSYFSLCFFLPSLYFPGRSIPVSASGWLGGTLIEPTSEGRLAVPWAKARRGGGVPRAQLWSPFTRSVLAKVRTTHLDFGCHVKLPKNIFKCSSHPSVGLRPDDGPGPGGLPRPALRAARTPGAPWRHLAVDHWGE